MWKAFYQHLFGFLALLLLDGSFVLASGKGTEVEIKFAELERNCLPEDGKQRLQRCEPSQVNSADTCILPPPPDPSARGSIKNDMYSNCLDTLALSQYIYELTELRRIARKHDDLALKESLEVSLKKPKSFFEIHKVLRNNLETMKEKGKHVDEAVDTLKFFFNSFRDKDISDETKKGGRRLHVVADDETSVSSSRVHAIVVNPRKKRVDVVFRGTTNVTPKNAWFDWSTNLKALWKRSQENPIVELKTAMPTVNLHRGFARVLLGKPKLEGPRPVDDILHDLKGLMGRGYRLHVTGHSLGGAIATLFGFYAATDPSITKNGPVVLFTFASPRVGGGRFREAFMFLEERGKIRHARIHNKKDRVPLLPYLGGSYKHVGMELRLRCKDMPVVDYPTEKNWKQSRQNLWDALTSLPEALRYHSCGEMLQRIREAEPALRSTSLQQEYQTMWGISF